MTDIKVRTDIETFKEKLATGNYLVIFKQKKDNDWSICYRPNDLTYRIVAFDYKLIHKKHKEVLEAYFKKEYKIFLNGSEVKDLLQYYNENHNYVIAYLDPIKDKTNE